MKLEKDSPIVYMFYAILGALTFVGTYHFSLNNEYKLCALLPTIPIASILGLYLIHKYNSNLEGYIQSKFIFILNTFLFYVTLMLFYLQTKDLLLSTIIGIVQWLFVSYLIFNYSL
jgi:uncharacterized membrane protein (GlpM family)